MRTVQIKASEIEIPHSRTSEGPWGGGADRQRIEDIRGIYESKGWQGLPLVVHEMHGRFTYHAWTGRHRLLAANQVIGSHFKVSAIVLPESAVRLCYGSLAAAENDGGKGQQQRLESFSSRLPHFVMCFEDKVKHGNNMAAKTKSVAGLIKVKGDLLPGERDVVQDALVIEKRILVERFNRLELGTDSQRCDFAVDFDKLIKA